MWNVDAKHSVNDMKTIVWTEIVFIANVHFYILPGLVWTGPKYLLTI